MSEIQKMKILRKWFKEEEHKGFDTSHFTQEEIIKRLRKTREELWEEKFKKMYEN